MFLDYNDDPKFHLKVIEKKRHWEFTVKAPVWVVRGYLKTTLKDPFKETPTTYKWNFRAIVGFTQARGFFVKKFPAEDESGSYSSLIRAVIWDKLKKTL